MFLPRAAGAGIHNKDVVKESKGAHRCLEEFPASGGRFTWMYRTPEMRDDEVMERSMSQSRNGISGGGAE